jgi:hypothetical protein
VVWDTLGTKQVSIVRKFGVQVKGDKQYVGDLMGYGFCQDCPLVVLTVDVFGVNDDLVVILRHPDTVSTKSAHGQTTEELSFIIHTGRFESTVPFVDPHPVLFMASKVVAPSVLGDPEVVRGNLKSRHFGFGSTLVNPVFFAGPKNLWHIDVQGIAVGWD